MHTSSTSALSLSMMYTSNRLTLHLHRSTSPKLIFPTASMITGLIQLGTRSVLARSNHPQLGGLAPRDPHHRYLRHSLSLGCRYQPAPIHNPGSNEICHLLNCVPLIIYLRTKSVYKPFSFLHINRVLRPQGSQLRNKMKAAPYIMDSIPNTMNYNLGIIDPLILGKATLIITCSNIRCELLHDPSSRYIH